MHTTEQADFREICSFFWVKIVCQYKTPWWTACTELHYSPSHVMWLLLFALVLTASTFVPSRECLRHVSALTWSTFCADASLIMLPSRSTSLTAPCSSWSTVPRIQTANPLQSTQSVPHSFIVFQNWGITHEPSSKLTVCRLVTEFVNLYKTQKIIAPPWARLIHSLRSVVIYLISILLSFSRLHQLFVLWKLWQDTCQ